MSCLVEFMSDIFPMELLLEPPNKIFHEEQRLNLTEAKGGIHLPKTAVIFKS